MIFFFFLRVVWGFLSQCSFHFKDRIVSVFNAVLPKTTKITGTQYWFSDLSFAHRDFSKVFMILGAVDDDRFKVVTILHRRTVKDFSKIYPSSLQAGLWDSLIPNVVTDLLVIVNVSVNFISITHLKAIRLTKEDKPIRQWNKCNKMWHARKYTTTWKNIININSC